LKIGIVVPVLNNFVGCVDALASVKTHHNWQPYIVPNYKWRWPLAQAWNWGVEQASDCDYVMVINDDILFSPYCIDRLATTLSECDKDVVMVTPHNMRAQIDDPYEILNMMQTGFEGLVDGPDFSCFMVKPDILNVVGRFDENFRPAYFEDNDYHRRINLLGLSAVKVASIPYYHYGSVSQNMHGPACVPEQFERNRGYYFEKWGGHPGAETYSTPYNHGGSPRDWIRVTYVA
jgi:GT2 family glycosyltransferase